MTEEIDPKTIRATVRASGTTAMGGPYKARFTKECPACGAPILVDDATTVVPLGPGADPSERLNCIAQRPYNAVVVEIHYECGFGESPGYSL